jgi:hypothetical protein
MFNVVLLMINCLVFGSTMTVRFLHYKTSVDYKFGLIDITSIAGFIIISTLTITDLYSVLQCYPLR